MQQFVVPQFIDVEDKIFGPITTRQFVILLAAGITIFVSYRYADTTLFVVLTLLVGLLAVLFAFVRVNGQVFHFFILNVIQTLRQPSLRIWHKSYSKEELDYFRKSGQPDDVTDEVQKKTVQKRHIRDLSLVVNTGGYYRPDEYL